MRKVALSLLLAVFALSMTVIPALADSIGPPP
jgi:hypothetical protein